MGLYLNDCEYVSERKVGKAFAQGTGLSSQAIMDMDSA